MIPTFAISDSDEVLAPCGHFNHLIRGKRITIRVTKREKGLMAKKSQKVIPDLIQDAMIGLEFTTIFSGTQFVNNIPADARVAYAEEVIETLEQAGEYKAAVELKKLAPRRLDVYVFEPGMFEVVE